MRIFLSHKSRDKPLVRDFKDQLPEFIASWLDEESLDWGGSLEESIRRAIQKDVDFVIAFIGKDALGSDWVNKEIKWALEREVEPHVPFFLPIIIDDLKSNEIPSFLSERVCLSLKDFKNESIGALAKEAQKHLFRIIAQDWSQNCRKKTTLPEIVILRDQASANEFVKQNVSGQKVEQAAIIQYSSDMAKPAIEHLLKEGIGVDLYLKDPETAISDFQSKKIEYSIRTYLDIWNREDRERGPYGNLRIAFYKDIGTVRGFRFSDGSILAGVYHYTKDVVWGHDIPVFFCPSGSPNVESLLERFDKYVGQLDKSELRDLEYYASDGFSEMFGSDSEG